MAPFVRLSEFELAICERIGVQRQSAARRGNFAPGLGPSATEVTARNHIRGVLCEFAASVLLNLGWRPHVGDCRAIDVGGMVEVRSTDYPEGRRMLTVKPTDHDERPFLLIAVEGPVAFSAVGWMFAHEAKLWPLRTEFGDPAHFVHQAHLRPVVDLFDWTETMRRQLVRPVFEAIGQ